jgi:hypothetical protein
MWLRSFASGWKKQRYGQSQPSERKGAEATWLVVHLRRGSHEAVGCAANPSVSPFDGYPKFKAGKHKVMGENNKWTAMGRIRNQAVQLRGRGGPKRLSGVSGRGIIHPEKSSLRSPNVPIFDEGSNSKAHILSKINPFSSKNGLQQNTNRMNSI